jgi:FMN reductase
MLKAFLDRYGGNGLAGTVAVPVMTGGWPGHLLAVERAYRFAPAES